MLHFTEQLGKDWYSHFHLSRTLNISVLHGQKNCCGVFSDQFLSVGGRGAWMDPVGPAAGKGPVLLCPSFLLVSPSAVGSHSCCKGNFGTATSCGCFFLFHRVSWRVVVKKAAGTLSAVLPWKNANYLSLFFSLYMMWLPRVHKNNCLLTKLPPIVHCVFLNSSCMVVWCRFSFI